MAQITELFRQPGVIPAMITGLVVIFGFFFQGWYLAIKLETIKQQNQDLAKHRNNRRESLTRLWHAVSSAQSAAAGMVSDSASADGTTLIACTTKFLQEISLFLDEVKLAPRDLSLSKQDVTEVSTVRNALVTLFLALDLGFGKNPPSKGQTREMLI